MSTTNAPRDISLIVVHCSATSNGKSLFVSEFGKPDFKAPVEVIDGWHRERGFARTQEWRARQNSSLTSIGYHFVIYADGTVVTGRHLDEVGAHVAGFNQKSIGICMIGTDKFTRDQWDALKSMVGFLQSKHPKARVVGHRDLSPDQNKNGVVEPFEWLKTCPGFDVAGWLKGNMNPPSKGTL